MLLISWALFILSSSKLRKLLFEFKKTWPIVQAICKPIEKIIVNIIYEIGILPLLNFPTLPVNTYTIGCLKNKPTYTPRILPLKPYMIFSSNNILITLPLVAPKLLKIPNVYERFSNNTFELDIMMYMLRRITMNSITNKIVRIIVTLFLISALLTRFCTTKFSLLFLIFFSTLVMSLSLFTFSNTAEF
ncbi:hypothetical protein D8797_09415 [Streptococcus cristatus]|nr:hypothetical protein D8797_09415 [Streptococcus cristatus]